MRRAYPIGRLLQPITVVQFSVERAITLDSTCVKQDIQCCKTFGNEWPPRVPSSPLDFAYGSNEKSIQALDLLWPKLFLAKEQERQSPRESRFTLSLQLFHIVVIKRP